MINFEDPIGIEPATFRPLAQCLYSDGVFEIFHCAHTHTRTHMNININISIVCEKIRIKIWQLLKYEEKIIFLYKCLVNSVWMKNLVFFF